MGNTATTPDTTPDMPPGLTNAEKLQTGAWGTFAGTVAAATRGIARTGLKAAIRGIGWIPSAIVNVYNVRNANRESGPEGATAAAISGGVETAFTAVGASVGGAIGVWGFGMGVVPGAILGGMAGGLAGHFAGKVAAYVWSNPDDINVTQALDVMSGHIPNSKRSITLAPKDRWSAVADKLSIAMAADKEQIGFTDGGDKKFMFLKNGSKYSLYEADDSSGVLVKTGDPLFTGDKKILLTEVSKLLYGNDGTLKPQLSTYLDKGGHDVAGSDAGVKALEDYFRSKKITIGGEQQHSELTTDPAIQQATSDTPAAAPDTSRVRLGMNALPKMVPDVANDTAAAPAGSKVTLASSAASASAPV